MARTRGLRSKRRKVADKYNIREDSLSVPADHGSMPHANTENETQQTAFAELNGQPGNRVGESQNMQVDEIPLNTQQTLHCGAEMPAEQTNAHASSSLGERKFAI
jgi:hypothetical protein